MGQIIKSLTVVCLLPLPRSQFSLDFDEPLHHRLEPKVSSLAVKIRSQFYHPSPILPIFSILMVYFQWTTKPIYEALVG